MTFNSTPDDDPADPPKKLTEYLTLSNIVPCLIFLALIGFVLFEFVIPEIRDYTDFWGAPPGMVEIDPVKTPTKIAPFSFKGSYGLYTHKRSYVIEPVSDYTIEARVLHKRHYYSDTNSADLIPFDLALGWGIMSDVATLNSCFLFHHINEGSMRGFLPVLRSGITPECYSEIWSGVHFSNNHIVPANDAVYETLRNMSAGDFVRLKGQLVNISRPDLPGWRWITTTRTREDASKEFHWGHGDAQDNMTDCDTMFVTEAAILTSP